MLHACGERFDVTGNFKFFLVFGVKAHIKLGHYLEGRKREGKRLPSSRSSLSVRCFDLQDSKAVFADAGFPFVVQG